MAHPQGNGFGNGEVFPLAVLAQPLVHTQVEDPRLICPHIGSHPTPTVLPDTGFGVDGAIDAGIALVQPTAAEGHSELVNVF